MSDNIKYGYHINDITKGEVGDFSKIEEEFQELKDAREQQSQIMELIELADLIGAIESYCEHYNLTINDLKTFSDITKRAFINEKRT